jgi:hypothetical protein
LTLKNWRGRLSIDDKLVLGSAGMSGFGKYVIVKVAEEMGYGVLVVGDVVIWGSTGNAWSLGKGRVMGLFLCSGP